MGLRMAALLLVAGCATQPAGRETQAPIEDRTAGRRTAPATAAAADHEALSKSVRGRESAAPRDAGKRFPQPTRAAAIVERHGTTAELLRQATAKADGGDLGGAVATVERAINLSPGEPWAWYTLAELRYRQRQLALAKTLAERSRTLAPEDARVAAANWLLLGKIEEQGGNSAAATAAFERAEGYLETLP
jgi:Flp pilus assembly protein TadD